MIWIAAILTVEGHEGQYILGYLEDVPVILMDVPQGSPGNCR